MTVRRDTGSVNLPALPPVNAQDPVLRNWMSAVAERLEVREGARGNRYERAVTLRELEDATKSLTDLSAPKTLAPGELLIDLGGGLTASVAIDAFVSELKGTRLYTDLLRRLDDPNRFNDLAVEVRSILLKSIADEAAARGADIRRTETLIEDNNRSLAIAVEEVTAAIGTSAAGVRELTSAVATSTSATAVKVTQLESSLGNYYQDGTAGRAVLESTLTTEANKTTGLRAQYTLKVQAGGALAGFGIASTEINGTPSSAFIISADKFAIVAPNYSGGLTNAPSNNDVPFGVDAGGIYMNTNVYVRGTMKVDTGGKTLIDGLRGSVNLSATSSAWSDVIARQAVWTALGYAASAVNSNHLVIGDTVTISNSTSPPTYVQTKYWSGSAWTDSGVIINGNLLVDGSIAAGKIDARGLTIKDAAGNIILNAGSSEFVGNVTGTISGTAASTVVSNASTALSTANTASSNATTALSNASTASTNATTALVAANTASSNATTAQSTATSASSAASAAQSTANTANSNATSALSTANTANSNAATAIAGLANKLDSNAANVLAGSGGIATGNLTWNSSGVRTGGYGIGLTQAGLVAYNSSGATTFVIDGSTGAASFAGTLSAAGGSFAGTLTAQVVNTANIVGAAITSGYAASSSGLTTSTTISVPAEASSVLILAYLGDAYEVTAGAGESSYTFVTTPEGTLSISGTVTTTQRGTLLYSVAAPPVGSYAISITRSFAAGVMSMSILVSKR